MLNKFAVALLAATVFTAPVLARSTSVKVTAPATIGAPAAPAKVATPVKVVKHIKKSKRHGHGSRVKHAKAGKAMTFAPVAKKGTHIAPRGALASVKPTARTN
jgi:hypothetical protein